MKRSPMKRQSSKRAAEQRRYAKLRKEVLIYHPWCFACKENGDYRAATEVHHYRGKLGRLLCDTRFFRSVCQEHHNYIHHVNPNEARRRGWLASAAEFGVYPADNATA